MKLFPLDPGPWTLIVPAAPSCRRKPSPTEVMELNQVTTGWQNEKPEPKTDLRFEKGVTCGGEEVGKQERGFLEKQPAQCFGK